MVATMLRTRMVHAASLRVSGIGRRWPLHAGLRLPRVPGCAWHRCPAAAAANRRGGGGRQTGTMAEEHAADADWPTQAAMQVFSCYRLHRAARQSAPQAGIQCELDRVCGRTLVEAAAGLVGCLATSRRVCSLPHCASSTCRFMRQIVAASMSRASSCPGKDSSCVPVTWARPCKCLMPLRATHERTAHCDAPAQHCLSTHLVPQIAR